jgi:CHAD domain-containing protein
MASSPSAKALSRKAVDDWHRTRIAAKKLRYGGEPLFEVLAPGLDIQRLSKQLSRLQKAMVKNQGRSSGAGSNVVSIEIALSPFE